MKKYIIYSCLILPMLSWGQICLIQGNVKDQNGYALSYANVYILGTLDGSTTDAGGRFSFKTKKSGPVILVCSFMGYDDYQKKLQLKKDQPQILEIILHEKVLSSKSIPVQASAFTSGEKEGVTLTPLEVVTTPGAAADIFWAVKSFPGVQQVDEGAGLFVRGGDVSETTVILDGAYLNHPYRYESPNGGFFGTITPFLLKGTYFSSGGYNAEYGNALSGVLVMESMDLPAKDNYTIGIGLAALSGAMAKIIIPEKLGINISGNYSDTETMFDLNNHRNKFSQFPKAYDININAMYKYSSSGNIKIFLFREVDKIGIEVKNPQYGDFYEGNSKNNLVNIQWKQLLSKAWFLSGNLAYTKFSSNRHLNILNLKTGENQAQVHFTTNYHPVESIKLKAGFESFNNLVNLKGTVPDAELALEPNAPGKRIDLDYNSQHGSIFVQNELTLFTDLEIISGIRSELSSNTSGFISVPRISATYTFKDNFNLIFAAGRYHQFPESYYYDSHIGNPKLTAMQADHYIAGLVYKKDQTIVRLETYYKNYTHLILKDSVLNYSNKGYGFAKGYDLFLKHSFGLIQGRISYSFLTARRYWMDAPESVSPDFDITHNLNVVLQANVSDDFKLGLAYRFATGKPYTSKASLYNDSRVPDYQKLDLNVSYLHTFFENNLTIFYIGISNLLGRDNIFDYYYSPDYQERYAVKSAMLRSVYFGISSSF